MATTLNFFVFLITLGTSAYAQDPSWRKVSEDQVRHIHETIYQPRTRAHVHIPSDERKRNAEIFSLGQANVWARSYEQYVGCFKDLGFDPSDLKGKVVVDLGCGRSNFVDKVEAKKAWGVDFIYHPKFGYKAKEPYVLNIYRESLRRAREAGLDLNKRVGASMTNLPFKSNSVDAVFAFMSLYYLRDQTLQQAIGEAMRVLAPGGKIYVINDDNPTLWPSEITQKMQASFKEFGATIRSTHDWPDRFVVEKIDCGPNLNPL